MRIAFASGKGGTGKTTLATNMAAVIAKEYDDILYADTDVEEPNGHIFLKPVINDTVDVKIPVPVIDESKCTVCGECAKLCEYNALAILGKKVVVFDSLCHSCGACVELCPERAITEQQRSIGSITRGSAGRVRFISGCLKIGEALSPPLIRTLKNLITDTGTTIIDAPPGTSCPVVESVHGCNFVVLVTEPTPFGLSDLELAYGLTQELHIPSGVVINRCDLGDSSARSWIESKGMEVLLEIPFRRQTAEEYSNGNLSCDTDQAFSDMMKALYAKILRTVAND